MIKVLRKKVDAVDKKILDLLKKRKKLTDKIKTIKKKEKLPERDLKREEVILKRAGKFRKVFKAILNY